MRSGGGENTAKALPESQENVVGFALASSARLGATNDLLQEPRRRIDSSGRYVTPNLGLNVPPASL